MRHGHNSLFRSKRKIFHLITTYQSANKSRFFAANNFEAGVTCPVLKKYNEYSDTRLKYIVKMPSVGGGRRMYGSDEAIVWRFHAKGRLPERQRGVSWSETNRKGSPSLQGLHQFCEW